MKTIRPLIMILLTLWAVLLAPYLIIGESWSLVLFDLCRPTSIWWKAHLAGLTRSRWLEVAAVTLIHSALIATLLRLAWLGLRRLKQPKPGGS